MSFLHYLDYHFKDKIQPEIVPTNKEKQVYIMAGGAASGKSTAIKDLKLTGIIYDIDKIKTDILKDDELINHINQEFKTDISNLNLSNTEDLEFLNTVVNVYYDLPRTLKDNIYKNHKNENLIFDVTLYKLSQLQNIVKEVQELGFNFDDIHVIWIKTDIKTALKRNEERPRKLSKEDLIRTHEEVKETMKIIQKNPREYFGGSFKIIET